MAVEVLHRPIVRQNLQLARGKEHGEEPVVVFVARVRGIGFPTLAADANGAGRAVMAIRHIRDGHLREGLDEGLRSRHAPHGVLNAIRCGEIVKRRFLLHGVHELIDRRGIAIGEEHRAGIRAQRADEPRAIVFLIATRLLVFLDDVVLVILDVADGGHADLHVLAHSLLVKIDARFRLADQRAFVLQPEEILPRLFINHGGIGIRLRRQIDLRAIHVQ